MKMMISTLSLVALIFGAVSCGNSNYKKLLANEWLLEKIEYSNREAATMPPANVYISFSDSMMVYGRGGCNNFFGRYTTEGSKEIDIEVGGSTMAYCPEMDFETSYFELLDDVDEYKVSDTTLQLKDDDKNFVLYYIKK